MFKTLRSASILILILLVSTLAAESMEPKFSGQIRYRFEAGDKDFVSATGFNSASLLRSRLNLKFAPTAGVTAVLQVQDSRTFGEELSTLGDGSADNLDLHQAYFVLNPSGVENLSLKVGRFEAVYGPQRLIGAVGWSRRLLPDICAADVLLGEQCAQPCVEAAVAFRGAVDAHVKGERTSHQ